MKLLSRLNVPKINCPKCDEVQPGFRRTNNVYEFLWGGNTCKSCGCKMDRFGKER